MRRLSARGKWRESAPSTSGRSTADRRLERGLLEEYVQLLEQLCPMLVPARHAAALRLARLPDSVRGYGAVKEAAAKRMRAERARLLEEFEGGDTAPVSVA